MRLLHPGGAAEVVPVPPWREVASLVGERRSNKNYCVLSGATYHIFFVNTCKFAVLRVHDACYRSMPVIVVHYEYVQPSEIDTRGHTFLFLWKGVVSISFCFSIHPPEAKKQ